jgi:hypothetical protein
MMIDDYEFEQMLAEAKIKLGPALVLEAVRSTTAKFGWPLSSEGKSALLFQLATRCRGN